jgi:hypothetical protein
MGAELRGYPWRRLRFQTAFAAAAGLLLAAMPLHARPVKTPRKSWAREDAPDGQSLQLRNTARRALIELGVGNGPLSGADHDRIIKSIVGEGGYVVTRRWSREALDAAGVQIGFSFNVPGGQRGAYAAMWRKRKDGKITSAAYVIANLVDRQASANDFLLVRSLSNQLRRGASPGQEAMRPPQLAIAPPPIAPPSPVVVPVPVPPQLVIPPLAAPVAGALPVVLPAPVPAIAPPPLPATTPPSALIVPPSMSQGRYAYTAAPGAGVKLGQVAGILYAPLEFSEVYVLFKDGSFHESLPVALEEWNVAAAKKGDPESWGKWKNASTKGEFEMHYGEGDTISIAAARIAPAPAGALLQGTYALQITDRSGEVRTGNGITFAGDRFKTVSAGGQSGGQTEGRYHIADYTLTLNHDDGRVEQRPYFSVPPEEGDDEPAIWFGDELLIKQ